MLVSGLNWTPYTYTGSQWVPQVMDKYWQEWDRRYVDIAEEGDTPEVVAGKVAFMHLHDLTMYNGVTNVTSIADQATIKVAEVKKDSEIEAYIKTTLERGKVAVAIVVKQRLRNRLDKTQVFTYLGALKGKTVKDVATTSVYSSINAKIYRLWDGGGHGLSGRDVLVSTGIVVGVLIILLGVALFAAGYATNNQSLLISGGVILIAASFVIPGHPRLCCHPPRAATRGRNLGELWPMPMLPSPIPKSLACPNIRVSRV